MTDALTEVGDPSPPQSQSASQPGETVSDRDTADDRCSPRLLRPLSPTPLAERLYITTRRPPPISSTRSRISFPGDRSDTSSRVSFTNFPTNYLLPGKNYNSRDSPYHCFLSGDSTGILYPRLPFINTFFPPTLSS
ncbi:hypothetical protein J6590_090250 [Homalodisca vitripennis]|nr:hypothetical protein J6590_090250 [Homalodisca vitripennis]